MNTNKTEPFTQSNQDANYAELEKDHKIFTPGDGWFYTKISKTL